MNGKPLFPVAVLSLLALLVSMALAWSHPHAGSVEDALSTGDDSEERLAAIAAHLKTEGSDDTQCELGSEMGRIAWERRAELPRAKEDEIHKITGENALRFFAAQLPE